MHAIRMEILQSDKFKKQYKKAPKSVKDAVHNRISLFEKHLYHPLLHNHPLVGVYAGFRSINITGDWRAVYRESKDSFGNTIVTFIALGTHSQLYK